MSLIHRLKLILTNSESKKLLGNFYWLSVLQLVNYVLPLVTLPYLARTIGVTGFGKVSFAAAVITWFQTISDWGFNYTATRDIARQRDNVNVVSKIFSNVLYSRFLLMICCLFVLILMIIAIPIFRQNSDVLLISFLLIPGHILFPDWLFQGFERMGFITILNVLAKILFTALVFIFITTEQNYILQPLFTALGYIVAGIISMYIVLAKWKIRILSPDYKEIISTVKRSTDVFINNFMPNLYNSFSVILIGFWGGNVANGKYDAGNKFVNVVIQLIQVISRTFFPFLSRKINHHKKFSLLNLCVATSLAIIIFIMAPWLVHTFFTSSFDDAIVVTRIMAFSLPFYTLSNVYGTNYLIIIGKERVLRNITCTVSIIGMMAAIPLVFYFSFIGAAATVSFTRALLGTSIYIKSKSIRNKNA